MPITPIHLPFVLLFFLMVALPLVASVFLLILPASRFTGRRLMCGSLSAGVFPVGYQVAYLPILLLSVVLTALLALVVPSGSVRQAVAGVGLLLGFYVCWFLALLWGYLSGFRVGWRFGGGTPILDSLRSDHLCRFAMFCYRWVRRRKRHGRDAERLR
jgi:hypothetical protein